ncbi:MAG TPA: hypothetical protein DEF88_12725 [Porphyromonadaceae bacterium]|nr:hypothetical protein [Porphyromonadaceae bacterium]
MKKYVFFIVVPLTGTESNSRIIDKSIPGICRNPFIPMRKGKVIFSSFFLHESVTFFIFLCACISIIDCFIKL